MVDHLFVVNIRVNLHFIYGKGSEKELLKFSNASRQSRRHRAALVGLAPQTKYQAPKSKYETL